MTSIIINDIMVTVGLGHTHSVVYTYPFSHCETADCTVQWTSLEHLRHVS